MTDKQIPAAEGWELIFYSGEAFRCFLPLNQIFTQIPTPIISPPTYPDLKKDKKTSLQLNGKKPFSK
jgi:hypothetical protein